eukprot:gene11860-biopygen5026
MSTPRFCYHQRSQPLLRYPQGKNPSFAEKPGSWAPGQKAGAPRARPSVSPGNEVWRVVSSAGLWCGAEPSVGGRGTTISGDGVIWSGT